MVQATVLDGLVFKTSPFGRYGFAAIRLARSDARYARKPLTLTMLRRHPGHLAAAVDECVIYRVALHGAGHAVAGCALKFAAITR